MGKNTGGDFLDDCFCASPWLQTLGSIGLRGIPAMATRDSCFKERVRGLWNALQNQTRDGRIVSDRLVSLLERELSELLGDCPDVRVVFGNTAAVSLTSRRLAAVLHAISRCRSATRLVFQSDGRDSKEVDFSVLGLSSCTNVQTLGLEAAVSPACFRSLMANLSASVQTIYLGSGHNVGPEHLCGIRIQDTAVTTFDLSLAGDVAGPLLEAMLSLGLQKLQLGMLEANEVRALIKMVKGASAPVCEVQVDDCPARLRGSLEAAVTAKNAPSLVFQLSLIEIDGDAFDLVARHLSGKVAATLRCSIQTPTSQDIPKLLRESKVLPASAHKLELLLPDGRLLQMNRKPVVQQLGGKNNQKPDAQPRTTESKKRRRTDD